MNRWVLISTTSRRLHRLAAAVLILSAALTLVHPDSVFAQAAPDIRFNIQMLKTGQSIEKAAAARFLIDRWQDSLEPLIDELATYTVGSAFQEKSADAPIILSVIDVLRTIIINKDEAIQRFRIKANRTKKAVQNLIWGARSGSKELRVNSTYILANIVDNTTICLVLHHLRDPDLSADGRVNLLQVVQVVATYAYKENAQSTLESIVVLKDNVSKTPQDLSFTLRLTNDIISRVNASANFDQTMPDRLNMNSCKKYNFSTKLE